MISVAEALEKLFALVEPGAVEHIPLADADGRVLTGSVTATRDQPPFSASAMDGYAVATDSPVLGSRFDVIGESAAGHGSDLPLSGTQAIRIFTGAPIPSGTKRILIQEDVTRDGDKITLVLDPGSGRHIRPSGGDFKTGDKITGPKRLGPNDLALMAAMNIALVPVTAKPSVAILATGDELVMPGETPGPDQIIASNIFGLKALVERAGGQARLLPIARDNVASLEQAFALAKSADLIVTVGGASVGDHDLVGQVAGDLGMDRAFYKVAMRPGKPLMAGRIGSSAMIGLPGNPVSAMVCGEIFLKPVLDKMLGLPAVARTRTKLPLAHDLAGNGPREHYMRGRIDAGAVTVADNQDSSLLSVLSDSKVLVVRPPDAPVAKSGEQVEVIALQT